MSRSNKSLSFGWLHVQRMLDKAAWSLAQRKVDFATLVEKTEITDLKQSNHGVEYTEYVFEVITCVPNFLVCYVRMWLRHKTNVPRVEKVLITSPEAVVLGEWDGTNGEEKSFDLFLTRVNRFSLKYLDELLHNRAPLAPYSSHSVQTSWMNHEMVILQQKGDVVIVQALDNNLHRPVAELTLRDFERHYTVETIKVFESLSIEVVSQTYHCSENLWSNE